MQGQIERHLLEWTVYGWVVQILPSKKAKTAFCLTCQREKSGNFPSQERTSLQHRTFQWRTYFISRWVLIKNSKGVIIGAIGVSGSSAEKDHTVAVAESRHYKYLTFE